MSRKTNKASRCGVSKVILLLASLFLLGLLGAISNMNLALAIASSESLAHYDEPSMTKTTKTERMQCLGLDEDEELDRLISNHRQLFVVFPAKAAGTTMKEFTTKCQPEFKNYFDYKSQKKQYNNVDWQKKLAELQKKLESTSTRLVDPIRMDYVNLKKSLICASNRGKVVMLDRI